MFQIIISGINKMGMFASILLLMTELGFLANSVKNYLKFKHFRKKVMIVAKIIQGVLMSIFMIVLVILSDKNVKSVEPVAMFPQKLARFCILAVIFIQMIFTIVMIVLGILDKLRGKKHKKKP